MKTVHHRWAFYVLATLCAGCSLTASLLPAGIFVQSQNQGATSFDRHQDVSGTPIDVWFSPDIAENPDLQQLQDILSHIADVEQKSSGYKPEEHEVMTRGSFALSFQQVSSTIRMVSVEGRIETSDKKNGTIYRFHDLVYDRHWNRLISIQEMFEDAWPNARAAFQNELQKAIAQQAESRLISDLSADNVRSMVSTALLTTPQWVLLPGEPNRTSSGIRFDFAPMQSNSSTDHVFHIEVPVSTFWQFLSDDWKQRFVKP